MKNITSITVGIQVLALFACNCFTHAASLDSCTVPPPSEIVTADFPTYLFSNSVPTEFSAGPESILSISSEHGCKDGGKTSNNTGGRSPDIQGNASCLRWDWNAPGAYFTYTHPDAFKRLTGQNPDPIVYNHITATSLSGFSLWVYNDTPTLERLSFEIGDGKTKDCQFWMNLNFSGWRELTFLYGRDLAGFPNPKTATTLKVIAPRGTPGLSGCSKPQGTLYFSHFCPRKEVDVRFCKSPEVAPWTGVSSLTPARIGVNDIPKIPVPAPLVLSPEQKAVLETISLRGQPKPSKRKIPDTEIKELISRLTHDEELPDIDMPKLYALRAPLQEAGAWDCLIERLLAERGDIKMIYTLPTNEGHGVTLGDIRSIIELILAQDNTPAKWQDLMAVKRFVNWCATHGILQSDGTSMWHLMINQGYGYGHALRYPHATTLLHGTPFEATQAEEMYKKAAKAMYFFSFPEHEPHFLEGRHHNNASRGWSFATSMILPWTHCGKPETSGIDVEMASIFLLYAKTYGKTAKECPDIATFEAMGIKPASPEGHLAQNYAVAGIHRRGEWMAMVRGQKKGIKANEMYGFQACNTMGRFLNYGHIIVHSKKDPATGRVSAPASGAFSFVAQAFKNRSGLKENPSAGWNWALWPGTTSRLLPHDALRSHFCIEETITAEPFCGDTSLDGNGVFGMKLDESLPGAIDPTRIGPVKYWLGDKLYDQLVQESRYDTHFKARKSVFMFDDRLVCLGSDIQSSDDKYPAVTTLFQHPLPKDKDSTPPQGKGWVMDSADIGYSLPALNNPLKLERKIQKLPFHSAWAPSNPELHQAIEPNEGRTEVAYFDHGVRADGAGYEYTMLINATPEKMDQLVAAPPYRVIRRDSVAHILSDKPSMTTGYVIFESGKPIGEEIVQASAPCIVMIKPRDAGHRKLSFCNPDLAYQYACNGAANEKEQTATLTLRGRWRVSGDKQEAKALTDGKIESKIEGETTSLTLRTKGATPAIVELEQAN